jgi:hypothetical protein
MVQAIKQRVTVGPGGQIHIDRSELPEGQTAEVIVVIEPPLSPIEGTRLVNYLGKAKGSFADAQEADNFLRGERDAWER